MSNGIKHRASESLRVLRETVADDDQADGEEHVCAEGREDLRPEREFPVRPGGVHEGHEERRQRADECRATNEEARGHAVHEHAYDDVKCDAGSEVREEIEGCG